MKNLPLLLPTPLTRDVQTWATVTALGPLRIKVDGDSAALPLTPDSLVAGLAVNDRVWVGLATNDDPEFEAMRVIVLGKANGYLVPHTHPQSDITGLVAKLAALPQGVIGFAEQTSHTGTSGTTELPLLRLDDIAAGAGRALLVYTNTIEASSTVNNDGFSLRLHYTTDGSTPTTASSEFVIGTMQTLDSQGSGSQALKRLYNPASNETLSLLLSIQRRTGTGSLSTSRAQIIIEDRGAAVSDTGTDL